MAHDSSISDLHSAHLAGQQKYAYFLLAAAGAAVGFAVQKTEGLTISWWLLPVGMATICWATSFFCGCKHITWIQTSLYANFNFLLLKGGSHPDQPTNPLMLAAAVSGIKSALERNVDKAQFYAIWQFRLLVIGAIFFLGWRVLEMLRMSWCNGVIPLPLGFLSSTAEGLLRCS